MRAKIFVFLIVILVVIPISCEVLQPVDEPTTSVSITVGNPQFNIGMEGSRVESSTWEHILPQEIDIVVKNKREGTEPITLKYNTETGKPVTAILEYGDYIITVETTDNITSQFLPFTVSEEIKINTPNQNIILTPVTDYGLVTLNHAYVESAVIVINDNALPMYYIEERASYYVYVKGGTSATLTVRENVRNTTLHIDVDVLTQVHNNFVLRISNSNANVIILVIDPFAYVEEVVPIGALEYQEGDTVKVTAEPNIGWRFSHWEINGEIDNSPADLTIIMPSYDLYITAHFVKI